MMTDLKQVLLIIQSFEACSLTAYKDIVNVWTIGWGHTGDVEPGDVMTQGEADALLIADVTRVANEVEKLLMVNVNANQFNALVSFAYNVGIGALRRSTLLRWLNGGEHPEDVANEFLTWDYAAGKEVPGLERRRIAERDLFLS